MKKLVKRISILASILCVALIGLFCVGCNGTEDYNYTVTVTLDGSAPAANVMLKFCILDAEGEELECRNASTDAEGKLTIDLSLTDEKKEALGVSGKLDYHVNIVFAPEGYKSPKAEGWHTQTDFTKNHLDIQLVAV